MPRFQGTSYKLWEPLYDTVQLAAAAGPLEYQFFRVPLGGLLVAGAPKGYQHTNMTQAGVLERGKVFQVRGYSMHLRSLAKAGAAPTFVDAGVVKDGHINVEYGQVSFLRSQASAFPSGGHDIVLNDTVTVNVQFGVSANANIFWLNGPEAWIDIAEQEDIMVTLAIPGTIVAVTDVTFVIWGMETRPVR